MGWVASFVPDTSCQTLGAETLRVTGSVNPDARARAILAAAGIRVRLML